MDSEDLKTKIVKQLEFYFSDSNLINDSFLTDLMAKDNGCENMTINCIIDD